MHTIKNSIIFSTLLALLAVISIGAFAQCVTPPAHMTNWWTADNHSFDIIGGNNGTLFNGADYGPGKVAQAFRLDGEDDYVRVASDPMAPFNFTGSFTIDAWVYLNAAPPQFAPIVSKWNDIGVNKRSYFLAIDTRILNDDVPRLRFDVSQDGQFVNGHSSIRISNAQFPINTWTHVAAVFNSTTHNLDVYINGQLANDGANISPTVTAPFITTEPLLIGAGDLGGDARDFFDGRIDEVELFNRALAAADIQSIYNAGSAGKTLPIRVDIKPGDDGRNPINLKSRGKIPVAVLSTPFFDATTIDVASIRFAGAPVNTRINGTFQYSYQDVNYDGLDDLVLHFATQMLVLTPSSTSATLTGITTNGRCVSGSDSIVIVPNHLEETPITRQIIKKG